MTVLNDLKAAVSEKSGTPASTYCDMLMDLRSGRFGVVTYTGSRQHAKFNEHLRSWVQTPLKTKLHPDKEGELPQTNGPANGSLVIMGGAMREGGNYSPSAEFNILVDPHAADIVST